MREAEVWRYLFTFLFISRCASCGATISTTLEIKTSSSREHWQSLSILPSNVSGVPQWPLCHNITDRCHHDSIGIHDVIILISCHDYPSIKYIVKLTSDKWSANHLLSSDAWPIVSCLCILHLWAADAHNMHTQSSWWYITLCLSLLLFVDSHR